MCDDRPKLNSDKNSSYKLSRLKSIKLNKAKDCQDDHDSMGQLAYWSKKIYNAVRE